MLEHKLRGLCNWVGDAACIAVRTGNGLPARKVHPVGRFRSGITGPFLNGDLASERLSPPEGRVDSPNEVQQFPSPRLPMTFLLARRSLTISAATSRALGTAEVADTGK